MILLSGVFLLLAAAYLGGYCVGFYSQHHAFRRGVEYGYEAGLKHGSGAKAKIQRSAMTSTLQGTVYVECELAIPPGVK